MIQIEIEIKRANLISRVHARIMRDINRGVMERQVKRRLPQHFTETAYSKYKARRRSKQTSEQKRKKYGHNRPNVMTGTLRDSIRTKITATQHGARLIIRAKMLDRLPPDEWAKLTPKQQAAENRKRRRLAQWQKNEIAVISKDEVREERKTMAIEYRLAALSPKNKRQRITRIK